MKRLVWSELTVAARSDALARPQRRREAEVTDVVRRIFDDVEREGEAALRRWSIALDGRAPERLAMTSEVVDAARAELAGDDLAALDVAVDNVTRFHDATRPAATEIQIAPGVRCRRVWRPIRSCGLYIPGGSAPLFSTLIMLALPARAAGVPERIAVTPPRASGAPDPMMIAAAAACGLDALYLAGGAQAIAALTFGVFTPKAQKIFGPGNAFVSEAKRFAAGLPDGPLIDVPAGPSELMVIADDAADAALVAADLLSQAEHDADAQVILVAKSAAALEAATREVERQLPSLPRAQIAAAALGNARAILVRSDSEAAEVANLYAPEHLSIQVEDAAALADNIENAGAIFIGRGSAETFGDYICGPSHVLPTDGAARAWSGVGVGSFMKSFVIQEMSKAGAQLLAAPAARLARLEGLEAHARAAEARLA